VILTRVVGEIRPRLLRLRRGTQPSRSQGESTFWKDPVNERTYELVSGKRHTAPSLTYPSMPRPRRLLRRVGLSFTSPRPAEAFLRLKPLCLTRLELLSCAVEQDHLRNGTVNLGRDLAGKAGTGRWPA
jgi:hypothetical protein